MHLERCGQIETHIIEHDRNTELCLIGPLIDTPAPLKGAVDSYDYYAEAAQHYSIVDTHSPFGAPPHTSRLFVFVRRAAREAEPAHLPSEPITIRDHNGRLLTTLSTTTSHVDNRIGYLAFSVRAAPGTYRIRAARSRRDVAITVPRERAAHVFIADCGRARLDDLRVSLSPLDRSFDPSSPIARGTESAIAALKSPHKGLPSIARSLSPHAAAEDLCFGIMVAHLAWRSREFATFEGILDRLRGDVADIPDLAILYQLRRTQGSVRLQPRVPPLALETPPLLRASMTIAMTRPEFDTVSDRGIERAARTVFHDSIWCTWSDRPYDERWVEPTVESLRARDPERDIRSIARTMAVTRRTVERTIDGLDATMPLIGGKRARHEDVRVPGYTLCEVLGRGGQGTVFRARRHSDRRSVAIKVVPLLGAPGHRERLERELNLQRGLSHSALLGIGACGALPDSEGLWLETELCRGSMLDLVSEADAPLSVDRACRGVLEALDGLAYLHAGGMVHRDIKPSNLLIRDDDSVVIADFGLAKSLFDTGQLTATGQAAGTVRFAPREQLIDFKRAPPASDVWSMAATLYFLLSLELPRDEYVDQSELDAAMENTIVPLLERCPDVPSPLARCIDRALSLDMDQRPRDGAALRAELAAVLGRLAG